MRYFIARAAIEAARAESTDVSGDVSGALFESFKKVYGEAKSLYNEEYRAYDPNITEERLDKLLPQLNNGNEWIEFVKAFQDVPVADIYNDNGSNSLTIGQIVKTAREQLFAGNVNSDDAGIKFRNTVDSIVDSAFSETSNNNLKNNERNFVEKIIKAGVDQRANESKLFIDSVHDLTIASQNKTFLEKARKIREEALVARKKTAEDKNAKEYIIALSDTAKISEIELASLVNYFGNIVAILGNKTFLEFDIATVPRLLSVPQESQLGHFVDKLLSGNEKSVTDAFVNMRIAHNLRALILALNEFDSQDNESISKVVYEIERVRSISPLYSRLMSQMFPGLIRDNQIDLTEENAAKAHDLLLNFAAQDVDLNGKMQAIRLTGYQNNMPSEFSDKATGLFISDVMATFEDKDNITTLSSSIRDGQRFINDLNSFSAEKLADSKNAYDGFLQNMRGITDEQ